MPSFDLLNRVELFMRSGKFPPNSSKNSRKETRAATRRFILKDGCLFRKYRGRLLRVVRSDEEIRDILIRYHDNNNHCGRFRMVREIMSIYYWVGVTDMVKNWVKACSVCQNQPPPEPPVRVCLAYGCDASSFVSPELSFHRFPKEAERRRMWLAVAQRDEGSLRSSSCLCSRHFNPSCFTASEEGQLVLAPDAVPTIVSMVIQDDKVPVPSGVDSLHSNTLEDLLSSSADPKAPVELQEHQYSLPAPDPDPRMIQVLRVHQEKKTVQEPSFVTYNQIARYLSHRILPLRSKSSRSSLKRMAKRFGLVDGALMYTKVSPPVRVPRSREEVNSILKQFHDNQGHYGLGTCQKEISKHFYWNTMSRDLARWINSCHFCLNRTKRRWFRCSISSCTNCCGPVERGLGLTFHNFPFKNAALMSQWIKATGRQHWYPRLRSSVCSLHFTEECFDRSEEKATLRLDAVPTLLVHSDSASQRGGVVEEENGNQEQVNKQAFFAKYDAVEKYLCSRTYPPGLTCVEKNTFRRFCKKFSLRDEKLHLVRGARLHLVLRNRQQVEDALKEFHDELNHLGVSKCLRLLNERYFWKTMRADVVQWINSCLLCNRKQRKKQKPEESETRLAELRSQRLEDHHSDSAQDDEEVEVCDEGSEGDRKGISKMQTPKMISDETTITNLESQKPETSPNPTSKIPILIIHLKPKTPLGLQNWIPTRPDVQNNQNLKNSPQETGPSLPEGITSPQTHIKPSAEIAEEPQTHQGTGQPRGPKTQMQSHASTQGGGSSSSQRPRKRKRSLEEDPPVKRNPSHGLEPVVAPSNKPWPVFTVAGSPQTRTQTQTTKHPVVMNRAVSRLRPRRVKARTIIQQCSRAKVQIRPALDGADARWAQIEEGMVVFVCFFNGATEDVTKDMANILMTTKFFRQGTAAPVSVLDLPGSVLLVPQESLQAEPGPRKRMQYEGGCEPWRAAQLFTGLVLACRNLMKASQKCTRAGVTVEEGVYGQRQEMVLNSADPLTHLLEF